METRQRWNQERRSGKWVFSNLFAGRRQSHSSPCVTLESPSASSERAATEGCCASNPPKPRSFYLAGGQGRHACLSVGAEFAQEQLSAHLHLQSLQRNSFTPKEGLFIRRVHFHTLDCGFYTLNCGFCVFSCKCCFTEFVWHFIFIK